MLPVQTYARTATPPADLPVAVILRGHYVQLQVILSNSEVNKGKMDHTKKSKHISFRVTEEQAIEIEMAALDAGIKAREWCRNVVLEKLGSDAALTPNERLLFHTLIRVQYLVTQGFQLLADQNLTSDGWKNYELMRSTAFPS